MHVILQVFCGLPSHTIEFGGIYLGKLFNIWSGVMPSICLIRSRVSSALAFASLAASDRAGSKLICCTISKVAMCRSLDGSGVYGSAFFNHDDVPPPDTSEFMRLASRIYLAARGWGTLHSLTAHRCLPGVPSRQRRYRLSTPHNARPHRLGLSP
jgi:hypothetical protein